MPLPRLLQIFPSQPASAQPEDPTSLCKFPASSLVSLPLLYRRLTSSHERPTPYRPTSFRRTDPRGKEEKGKSAAVICRPGYPLGNTTRQCYWSSDALCITSIPLWTGAPEWQGSQDSFLTCWTRRRDSAGLAEKKHVDGVPSIVCQLILSLLVPTAAQTNVPVSNSRTGYSRRGIAVCTRAATAGTASRRDIASADRSRRQIPDRPQPVAPPSPTVLQRTKWLTNRREKLLTAARHACRGSLDYSQVLIGHPSAPED